MELPSPCNLFSAKWRESFDFWGRHRILMPFSTLRTEDRVYTLIENPSSSWLLLISRLASILPVLEFIAVLMKPSSELFAFV